MSVTRVCVYVCAAVPSHLRKSGWSSAKAQVCVCVCVRVCVCARTDNTTTLHTTRTSTHFISNYKTTLCMPETFCVSK